MINTIKQCCCCIVNKLSEIIIKIPDIKCVCDYLDCICKKLDDVCLKLDKLIECCNADNPPKIPPLNANQKYKKGDIVR